VRHEIAPGVGTKPRERTPVIDTDLPIRVLPQRSEHLPCKSGRAFDRSTCDVSGQGKIGVTDPGVTVRAPGSLRDLARSWHEPTACVSCTPGSPPPSAAVRAGLRIWSQAFSQVQP
jgi:hypothetical protein